MADAGAAFGSGASATVFGARGSGSFLTKITTLLAVAFFANSLGLAYLSAQQPEDSSLLDSLQTQQTAVQKPQADKDAAVVKPQAPSADNAAAPEAAAAAPATGNKPADVPPSE